MFWMLPIAGAVLGAMANKENPTQGAITGGLLGMGGGAAMGAMGAAGAAGAAGAGAAGAGTAAGVGAGAAGAGAAGAAGAGTAAAGAGAGASGGLLGTMGNVATAASTGLQAAKMLQPQVSPMQPAQLSGGGFDASPYLQSSQNQIQNLMAKRQNRGGFL